MTSARFRGDGRRGVVFHGRMLLFPRRYSWFSELQIEAMAADIDREAVGAKLDQMGRAVGRHLRSAKASLPDRGARWEGRRLGKAGKSPAHWRL